MNIPSFEILNSSRTEPFFKKNYFDFWKYLEDNYPKTLKFKEKAYWYLHNFHDYPKCKICGNPITKFYNINVGYREYCSTKCSNSDQIKKDKTIKTNNERYGGNAPACSKDVIEKSKHTCLEKYGVESVHQLQEVKDKTRKTMYERYGGFGNASDILKERYIKTSQERYGANNYTNTNEYRDKMKNTCLEKYGVEHHSQNDLIRQKISNTRRFTEVNKRDYLIGYTLDGEWICKCPHPECNKCTQKYYIISASKYEDRIRDHTEICTNLLPIGKDNTKNTSIELFIQRILDKCNINYQTNVRGLIDGQKELDIYIPEKQFAIECNGILSHSDKYKDKHYHENKTIKCNENNIRLLHIWEDWIKQKPQIVESMIKSKLGISENKIFARKCRFEICVDKKEYLQFMDNNHIQGRSNFEVGLGLRYNDKLVSVMTFGHKRGAMGSKTRNDDEWELIRFCSILNTQVIGAASRLFSHFVKEYNPKSIFSFASNDISDGNVYNKLGFIPTGHVNSSYWYIDPIDLKRYHRTSFTKSAIVRRGWKDKVDNTWTEKQVMEEVGYLKIYDSGQTRWDWNVQ